MTHQPIPRHIISHNGLCFTLYLVLILPSHGSCFCSPSAYPNCFFDLPCELILVSIQYLCTFPVNYRVSWAIWSVIVDLLSSEFDPVLWALVNFLFANCCLVCIALVFFFSSAKCSSCLPDVWFITSFTADVIDNLTHLAGFMLILKMDQ